VKQHTETILLRRSDESTYTTPGVSVTVYETGETSTAATIYSDNGVTTTSNPLETNYDGEVSFYAADGEYDFKITGAGLSTKWLYSVQIFEATPYVYDITTFGAKIDGTTDDLTAVQAAITAAAGAPVLFPTGTCYLSAPVTLPSTSSVTLRGEPGAVIDGAGTSVGAIVFDTSSDHSDILIEGLTFSNFAGRVINSPTSARTYDSFTVRNCVFDTVEYGIWFNSRSLNTCVENCDFTTLTSADAGAIAIRLGVDGNATQTACGKHLVRGNRIDGVTYGVSDLLDCAGILVYGTEAIITDNFVSNVSCTNAGNDSGHGIGIKCRFATVSGNRLLDAGNADDGHIYVKGYARGATSGTQGYGSQITGNSIISTKEETWNASETGINLDTISDLQVRDNYIEGLRGEGIKAEGYGTYNNIVIADNTIAEPRGTGISVRVGGYGMRVTGNTIYASTGTSTPIHLNPLGDLTGCVVADNVITNLAYATGAAYGILVKPTGYSTTDCTITDLVLKNNVVRAVSTHVSANAYGIYIDGSQPDGAPGGLGYVTGVYLRGNSNDVTCNGTAYLIHNAGTRVTGAALESRTGAATPSGSIAPLYVGEIYLDITASKAYVAKGMGNTDWFILN